MKSTDKMRFIFESPYRTVEISSSSDETWMEHIDMFIDFLRGCGYVVDDQMIADYLTEFTDPSSHDMFEDDFDDQEVTSWSFDDNVPESGLAGDTIPQDSMNASQSFVFSYEPTTVTAADKPVTFTIRSNN